MLWRWADSCRRRHATDCDGPDRYVRDGRTMTQTLPALVEGNLEAAVLPEIFKQIGLADIALRVRIAGGGDRFWREATRYNTAARYQPMVGLADVEQAPCAAQVLVDKLPGGRHESFHLRLAVRMLDAWLMADREAIAQLLGVRISRVPQWPDDEQHPKRKLVELARLSSKRTIRESLVPSASGASVGAEYVPVMAEFARTRWRVVNATGHSPSLERACIRWRALQAASALRR